jgi:hypothetical protein
MAYKGMYLDGDQPMVVQFPDQAGFVSWAATIKEIKDEAARIIAECPDTDHLTGDNIQAIRIWLQRIDAMVKAGTPVIPSILSARNNFVTAIAGEPE